MTGSQAPDSAYVYFTLTHDGQRWIASNREVVAGGETLEALDADIRNKLGSRFSIQKGTTIQVNMEYDYGTMPLWIRQYHPYYFRRVVYLEF